MVNLPAASAFVPFCTKKTTQAACRSLATRWTTGKIGPTASPRADSRESWRIASALLVGGGQSREANAVAFVLRCQRRLLADRDLWWRRQQLFRNPHALGILPLLARARRLDASLDHYRQTGQLLVGVHNLCSDSDYAAVMTSEELRDKRMLARRRARGCLDAAERSRRRRGGVAPTPRRRRADAAVVSLMARRDNSSRKKIFSRAS